ncbi:hypothetical protein PR048_017831 [Dryococelus australis]|uniref:Uncharacterized protein n=1 Tax=Dryococelus australis TaxID=614101 RepID=A0ABQ9HAS2_9NEOP|nr:hypothetical protein PR048_017831 [Dryococelus australis]
MSINKSHFSCPVLRDCCIYSFPDCPHLLQLLQNWLLDGEFEIISSASSTEVRSCHKLSMLHVECDKNQCQKVCLAAELLSHTTATATQKYSTLDCAETTDN